MQLEPSSQLIPEGYRFSSPGGRMLYKVNGPCCRLYDREDLPWPSCSTVWKGKQPSWNRIGRRFVADLASSRCPSYSVTGTDGTGLHWDQVITIYYEHLSQNLGHWWITKKPKSASYPELPQGALFDVE